MDGIRCDSAQRTTDHDVSRNAGGHRTGCGLEHSSDRSPFHRQRSGSSSRRLKNTLERDERGAYDHRAGHRQASDLRDMLNASREEGRRGDRQVVCTRQRKGWSSPRIHPWAWRKRSPQPHRSASKADTVKRAPPGFVGRSPARRQTPGDDIRRQAQTAGEIFAEPLIERTAPERPQMGRHGRAPAKGVKTPTRQRRHADIRMHARSARPRRASTISIFQKVSCPMPTATRAGTPQQKLLTKIGS